MTYDEIEIAHRAALDPCVDEMSTENGLALLQKTIEEPDFDYQESLRFARHLVIRRLGLASKSVRSTYLSKADKRIGYNDKLI